jgi:uncharacterized protein (UPF0332 family)
MSRVQQLLTLANEELATAELLWQNDRYRACISRSYYAMYHATQALLTLKDLNTKTHKGIIQMFGQHFIKTEIFPVELARALGDAYDMRRLSDYEETIVLSAEQSEIVLNSARSFIDQAVQYCENVP